MGVFVSAAAEMSKERGEHQDCRASHNSYTQISSETGVIGFVIISAVFFFSLRALLRLNRTARRLKLKEAQSMSLCMLLSSIALAIHFFFDAIAYDFYLPMVAGLGTALVWTTRPVIEEAEASLRSKETGAETRLTRFTPTIPADAITKSPTKKLVSNPYKLSRRRATSRK